MLSVVSITLQPAPTPGRSSPPLPVCCLRRYTGCSFPECNTGRRWKDLRRSQSSSSTSTYLQLLSWDREHNQLWGLCVSAQRFCPLLHFSHLSVFAPEVRTRPVESRSGSYSTPKWRATRRANMEESAYATTHASAPRAMKERPANMVMWKNCCLTLFWKYQYNKIKPHTRWTVYSTDFIQFTTVIIYIEPYNNCLSI